MITIAELDYITAGSRLPPYIPFPRFLLALDISQTAKLLYALLLDRARLSRKNGWQDSEGRIYVIFPREEMAEALRKDRVNAYRALNELETAGLLERKRYGSSPNRLYVKAPHTPDGAKIQHCENATLQNCNVAKTQRCENAIEGCKNATSDVAKTQLPYNVKSNNISQTIGVNNITHTLHSVQSMCVARAARDPHTHSPENAVGDPREQPGSFHNSFTMTPEQVKQLTDSGVPGEFVRYFCRSCAEKGYGYANPVAQCRRWWRTDRNKPEWQADQASGGSFETKKFFDQAVRASDERFKELPGGEKADKESTG